MKTNVCVFFYEFLLCAQLEIYCRLIAYVYVEVNLHRVFQYMANFGMKSVLKLKELYVLCYYIYFNNLAF